MKSYSFILLSLAVSSIINAQRIHVGVFGGLAAYNGDLVDRIFPKKVTNGAIGVTVNYELRDKIMIRGGYTYAVVGGADRYSSDPELVRRNLSFETAISEFSLVGEYYFQNLYDRTYSPYIFGGLALYRFNPYAYSPADEKVFLQPLSTEGQGLPGYPNRQPYQLTQFALPFGGGIKFRVNDNLRVGLEVGFRKLFTDYLDDVSTQYADPADLLAAKGQLALDMSYRSDELPDGDPAYPLKGAIRGGEKYNDIYYFTGIHLTYRINGGKGVGGGRRFKCPTVPL